MKNNQVLKISTYLLLPYTFTTDYPTTVGLKYFHTNDIFLCVKKRYYFMVKLLK